MGFIGWYTVGRAFLLATGRLRILPFFASPSRGAFRKSPGSFRRSCVTSPAGAGSKQTGVSRVSAPFAVVIEVGESAGRASDRCTERFAAQRKAPAPRAQPE